MHTPTHAVRILFLTLVRFSVLALFLSLGAVLTGATANAANAPSDSDSSPLDALAAMLNRDGTLNLPPGYTGAISVSGWDLVSGDGEAPRFAPRAPGDERWSSGFNPSGVNGVVYAIAIDATGNVYVAGQFGAAGNILTANIAMWNGTSWSAVGGTGLNGTVYALAYNPVTNSLYAGGSFNYVCAAADCALLGDRVNKIAKWNGTAWSGVGSGFYQTRVNALAWDSFNNLLYAGGEFTYLCPNVACAAAGTRVNYVAKWNGAWVAMDKGVNNSVYSLGYAPPGNIYVGGALTGYCTVLDCSATTTANYIAKWFSTSVWGPVSMGLNNGTNGPVRASLWATSVNSMFLAGDFTTAGGVTVNHVARWNTGAASYYALGLGLNGNARSLFWDDANKTLYVGGDISGLCTMVLCNTSTPVNKIAKWDNTAATWSGLGDGLASTVYALGVKSGRLYAGGSFAIAGSAVATGIAQWTIGSGAWSSLYTGNSVDTVVQTVIADHAGNVYVGGPFRTAGGVQAFGIARWDRQSGTWSAMGYGVAGVVYAFAIDRDGNLIVGGTFTHLCGNIQCTAPGMVAHSLVKWDRGSGTWSPVAYGIGPGGVIRALATDNAGNIYAGGTINLVCNNADCSSNSPASNIVKYTASSGTLGWSGPGIFAGSVFALAVGPDNSLYAGGVFNNLCVDAACGGPGPQVNNIARWNGSWSALDKGLKGPAYNLAVDSSGNLYAGGGFVYACGSTDCLVNGTRVNLVAKFASGGSAWAALGNGLIGVVYGMATDEKNNLFIGGVLPWACIAIDCAVPGPMLGNVSQWNGTAWVPLGSGIPNAVVFGLTAQQGVLSVGGTFSGAGGKVSANFAQYTYGYSGLLPYIAK